MRVASTFVRWLILAFGLAAAKSATIASDSDAADTDSWYQAPPGFESKPVGTVLKLRPAPGNLTSVYGNSSSVWNVLFRTTDELHGFSYQIAYNVAYVKASPSYTLGDPHYAQSMVGSEVQTLLSYGWFVNVPDHEGPLASLLSGVTAGHAVLDSIRAVESLQVDWAPNKHTRVALWGYSGASLASEFAAELQAQYAPELDIAGTAIGGLPANITVTMLLATKSDFSGLVAAGTVGLSRQHPDLRQALDASLKQSGSYNATTFFSVDHLTAAQAFQLFSMQDMSQYFVDGFDFFRSPAWVNAADDDVILGYHGIPQMPLFIYQAVNDELCPITGVDPLVNRCCSVGVDILYQRNSIGGHVAEEVNADTSALKWLRSVLEGNYRRTGCFIQDVSLNISDSPL